MEFTSGATATSMKESGIHVCVMVTALISSPMEMSTLVSIPAGNLKASDSTSGTTAAAIQDNLKMV